MSELNITKTNLYEEVMNSDKPVLLDFWAEWCGPCKMVAPVVEAIAKEQEGVIKVGKVNVDEQPELATVYEIASIPTLIVVKKGKVIAREVGFRPKDAILAMLK